jgi:hypothetical protein
VGNDYQSWKEALQEWIKTQLKSFYCDVIRELMDFQINCIGKKSDYVEK